MQNNDLCVSEIIALAWCDKTSFDAIQAVTNLSEKEVIQLMRKNLKLQSFKLWRQRVTCRKSKHRMKRQCMQTKRTK